ncbi:MAG TPA: hypothetical protein VNK24_00145 [Elusimicrobiota bacterium]|nr:hypothetical protein [Elusimicrobiota bacterium]
MKIQIPRGALNSIFDECDKYDSEETGGRLVGFCAGDKKSLEIRVHDVIGPGPKARRTATSFFQDGEFQESEFRRIEASNPSIEHLGNWHTHHVNGLETLSDGDIATYGRTVNHSKHNTHFFYAILVTRKNRSASEDDRYAIKHFLFLRGTPGFKELSGSEIEILSEKAISRPPASHAPAPPVKPPAEDRPMNSLHVRAQDNELMLNMYPDIRPFVSEKLGTMYWRGRLDLIDNTSAEVLVMETMERGRPSYEITVSKDAPRRFNATARFERQKFSSAQLAIWSLERALNAELFEDLKKSAPKTGKRGGIEWK